MQSLPSIFVPLNLNKLFGPFSILNALFTPTTFLPNVFTIVLCQNLHDLYLRILLTSAIADLYQTILSFDNNASLIVMGVSRLLRNSSL